MKTILMLSIVILLVFTAKGQHFLQAGKDEFTGKLLNVTSMETLTEHSMFQVIRKDDDYFLSVHAHYPLTSILIKFDDGSIITLLPTDKMQKWDNGIVWIPVDKYNSIDDYKHTDFILTPAVLRKLYFMPTKIIRIQSGSVNEDGKPGNTLKYAVRYVYNRNK